MRNRGPFLSISDDTGGASETKLPVWVQKMTHAVLPRISYQGFAAGYRVFCVEFLPGDDTKNSVRDQ